MSTVRPHERPHGPAAPGTPARRVVLAGVRRLELDERALPELAPGDLLVRIALCGICATDLHFWHGHLGVSCPLVLGHEFVGEVAAIGAEAARRRGLAVGDHVAVEMSLPCRACARCREGRYNLCEEDDPFEPAFVGREYGCNIDGNRAPGLWGGYGEYLFVPGEAIVHRLPAELPWEVAVFTEPLSVAFRAVGRARVRPGDTVAVLGPGPVGLMLTMAAKAAGADRVVVTGTRADRLALARRFGADLTVDVRNGDPAELVRGELGGLVDVAIEAAGTATAQEQAVSLVRRGGRVTITGACGPARITLRPDEQLLLREVDLLPSFLSAGGYEPAIGLLSRGAWPVEELVTHRFGLDEVERAFGVVAAREEGAIKAVLDPWGASGRGGHV